MEQRSITYELHSRLKAMTEHARTSVINAVEQVSKLLVSENPRYWSAITSLGEGDKGVALAFDEGKPVGFWIVDRLAVGKSRGLYSTLTNVVPGYQGYGIAWEMRSRFLLNEMTSAGSLDFLAFRTRNPMAWQLAAKMCSKVAPDILGGKDDPELLQLGRTVASSIYPDKKIESSTLVMLDVYPPMCCGAKEQHHRDPAIDAAFFSLPSLTDRKNGRFFIGHLKPRDEIAALSSRH